MKTIRLAAACLILATSCICATAQVPSAKTRSQVKTKTQRYVELVSGNDILKGSGFGVLAMKVSGDTVASWRPEQRLLPASNMKLVTTGAAIHKLGPDFKYATRIGYSGTIKDGVLEGDIYIIGGGDPTIASKDSIATPRFFLLSQWKGFLDKAGIRKIDGRIIGDGRYFDGSLEHDCWNIGDAGYDYGVGGDGLCWYENVQEFKVSAGKTVGSDVTVSVSYPVTPWMKYSFPCKTAAAGTGDELGYYTTPFYPYGEIRGTFAIDRKPKTEDFSNKFGAYTCAQYLCDYLKSNGIEATGGAADIHLGRIRTDLTSFENGPYASKVDDLNVIGTTYSPSLKAIIAETNHKSDNFYAETLLRTLGRQMHHSACYDSSRVAITEVLCSIGADPKDVQISDGSGLARHNYLSPEYLVKFLSSMMGTKEFGDYVETLGQPGGSHYESRLKGEADAVKSRIHYKSGSMNGVRCFSGYIEPSKGSKNDVIIFSVMTNNALVGTSKVDPIIDKIIAIMASEN